jgi:hypothetical protein
MARIVGMLPIRALRPRRQTPAGMPAEWGSGASGKCSTMVLVPSSPLFWPAGRKLFRQRSRLRLFVPLAALLALAGLVVAFGPGVWG